MHICRFKQPNAEVRIGLVLDQAVVADLSAAGIESLQSLLESEDPVARLNQVSPAALPQYPLSEVQLCPPVEGQEVWAAGVTYLRSKHARMQESAFSANAYDRVYEAERPELFFKSLPEKVVPDGEPVGIRRDARWNVPEPELALVLCSRGRIVGYTIGNDMSARDIEGENLLYLPQAKIYHRSCALGPWITLGVSETTARQWTLHLAVRRAGSLVFSGQTVAAQIKRAFPELAGFLFRSQMFPRGAILLTGTGIVPPDDFTLHEGDRVEIAVSGIGRLSNPVVAV